jgi:serine/threonine protein kinase
MENPTATTLPVFKPLSEKVGSKIGVYKLLEVIGEGGFGTVFMAEQSVPVRRRVALKIIKLGMDTRQVVARFEQERQALAMMDHPNIAKVYDAGATETGRPYFVMEYVRGEPITRFVAERKLTLRARLELLLQVCRAVQHAHTKGVIHRDIKPSNVLVSVVDGQPLAKVIDFGIAKATGAAEGRLTEKTLFTEHRQLIGTLEYMSPEQVEGSADIDTRSDVYGLGVLLYEILTGETPIDGKRLRSAAHGEIQRIILEEDPQVPSVRVTGSAKKRGASAGVLKGEGGGEGERDPWRMRSGMAEADEHVPRMLRGELDWIVMKALEKDRGRRYASPSELAEDIERHLTGEPVRAAPPSTRYRVMKFARRNRAIVVGGVAVSAALLVGLAGTAWQWRQAVSSERDAVTQA